MSLVFPSVIEPNYEEEFALIFPTTKDEADLIPCFGCFWERIPENLRDAASKTIRKHQEQQGKPVDEETVRRILRGCIVMGLHRGETSDANLRQRAIQTAKDIAETLGDGSVWIDSKPDETIIIPREYFRPPHHSSGERGKE